ncbi:MAG: hypothetical protein LBB91_08985, partial [Clostridiales bacterium]|nr:hypothetical protein [Clostridiales bacterium]
MQTDSINLVCISYAGAGPSVFNGWADYLPSNFNLFCPGLAGKDKRFNEPAFKNINDSVNDITNSIINNCELNKRTIIFGHSLGAILSYEVARKLEKEYSSEQFHIVVCGSPGPTIKRKGKASGLSDEDFCKEVEQIAGYRHPSFENPLLRELLLPSLRADVLMHESYNHVWTEKTNISITCMFGNQDHVVSRDEALAWQDVTAGPLNVVVFDGGHMFWVESVGSIINKIINIIHE